MTWTLHPRLAADTHHVASLGLSDVLLMDDRTYPWLILVPRVSDAVEWIDLGPEERHALLDEVALAGRALREMHAPDKLNVGALGNVVSQLHVHVIARFHGDAAWPKPVWGASTAVPYDAPALGAVLRQLRGRLVPS
jgi:diadenosine tetraphosphate (Ap4A) HIT family hydrolase